MSVTYFVQFDVVPAEGNRFLFLLNGVLDAMRHEPMFHQAALHEDPDDPNRLLLVEMWQDHDDVVDVQLHRPYRQAFHDALPELLAQPRASSVWRIRREVRREDRPGSQGE